MKNSEIIVGITPTMKGCRVAQEGRVTQEGRVAQMTGKQSVAEGCIYGYIRVSSREQNEARQVVALHDFGIRDACQGQKAPLEAEC